MYKGLEALNVIKGTQQHLRLLSCGELKAFEIIEKELRVLDFIRSHIVYNTALCDKTKNPYNHLIVFEIRGLVDEATWLEIFEGLFS